MCERARELSSLSLPTVSECVTCSVVLVCVVKEGREGRWKRARDSHLLHDHRRLSAEINIGQDSVLESGIHPIKKLLLFLLFMSTYLSGQDIFKMNQWQMIKMPTKLAKYS